MASGLMKRALLAASLATVLAAGHAAADSYYFRQKGNPPGALLPSHSSSLAMALDWRVGADMSGSISTTVPGAAWSFTQTPASPSLSLSADADGVSGVAPAVAVPTRFEMVGVASAGKASAATGTVSITVHPKLAMAGGPAGTISADLGSPFPAQADFSLSGAIGSVSYELLQSGSAASLSSLCPGLSFSGGNGKISGTPTDTCNVNALSVRATDAFDQTSVTGHAFNISMITGPSNAVAWGRNGSGQLGDGTTTDRPIFVPVMTGKTYTRIAGGVERACGIVDDGSLECWGYGDLGDGSSVGTTSTTPVKVVGLTSGVTAVAIGSTHTCAIHNGLVKCWGSNLFGELGDGTTLAKRTPVAVTNLSDGTVTSIHTGPTSSSTCAILSGGIPRCWGKNSEGQLGTGDTAHKARPTPITNLTSGVSSIAVGPTHTCAIQNGAAKCWGSNGAGALGNNTTVDRVSPGSVSGLTSNVTAISAGSGFSCAIHHDAAKCWGFGGSGRLGNNSTANQKVPVQVFYLTDGVSAISSGHDHTCAIHHGTMNCWGYNANSQLGDGTTANRSYPVVVTGLSSDVRNIAAGGHANYSWD